MTKATKTRRFAVTKKLLSPNDPRLKDKKSKNTKETEKRELEKRQISKVTSIPTAMFFSYNSQLGPPFRVLVDTNFINFSIRNKLEMYKSMMDCLLAKCIPCITDCVMAELEKLGQKYTLALRLAKDPRFERLSCCHKGTYADDCIVERVTQHRCFIVATCDKELKKRIRKVPGVPIMFIAARKYTIERMPEAFGAPR